MTCGISISICTMDRPDLLERCLASIVAGTSLPDEVLVSDDSVHPEATRTICAAFPFVTYLAGPRRGLCANRNRVVRAVETSHVCLLDDDSTVEAEFVAKVRALIPTLEDRTILTGDVLEYGGRTRPRNPTFWGHFQAEPFDNFKTINLNCNVFPVECFSQAEFDERVVYGYEDVDLCACLIAKGFRIRYEPSLVNRHLPPEKPAFEIQKRYRLVQQARFQVSMKRYLLWENSVLKSAAFLFLAPLHRSAHAIKLRLWEDIPLAVTDIALALTEAVKARAALKPSRRPVRDPNTPSAWFAGLHSAD